MPPTPPVAYLFLVRPMRVLVAICVFLVGCGTTERTPPALPAATRIEVTDTAMRVLKRITSAQRVSAIVALIDAQHSWKPPMWADPPVGSFQIYLYSGSRRVEWVDYGPGWLMRGFPDHPYCTTLLPADNERLLRLLGLRREDIR